MAKADRLTGGGNLADGVLPLWATTAGACADGIVVANSVAIAATVVIAIGPDRWGCWGIQSVVHIGKLARWWLQPHRPRCASLRDR